MEYMPFSRVNSVTGPSAAALTNSWYEASKMVRDQWICICSVHMIQFHIQTMPISMCILYIYIISSNSSIIFIIEIHKTWIKHIPLICVASHHPADKPTAPQRCWSELPGQRGKCRGNQGAVSCQNLEKHWKMHQNCPSKKSNDVKICQMTLKTFVSGCNSLLSFIVLLHLLVK